MQKKNNVNIKKIRIIFLKNKKSLIDFFDFFKGNAK